MSVSSLKKKATPAEILAALIQDIVEAGDIEEVQEAATAAAELAGLPPPVFADSEDSEAVLDGYDEDDDEDDDLEDDDEDEEEEAMELSAVWGDDAG